MFAKILIANRGEIALRVMRTCRRLGVRTVAVYSEADRDAAHVAGADEAVLIGPAPARDSYLRAGAIIEAALRTGAQAIHPGYGFLSENAEFAEAAKAAGLVFIGPPVEAIRVMGSKSAAKALMEKAGVPLVPGYHGADQADAILLGAAKEIGWPVLLKASAGGGGKGMRVVGDENSFAAALESARREALSAFGDQRMLVEKYLQKPRHVEIQVFADTHGNAVHLFERDCSIQRRHQKVVEEAPAPGMTPALRARMGEAAVAAAKAIGYVGAGTVEFLLDTDGRFYFMEMNTRLQVEHPVTEMITGQDLVAWQLDVASGQALPLAQDQIPLRGHAIETRLYAEDPDREFLPSTGRILHLHWPRESAHLRLDSGVREGDVVSIHYDPMLAKLIVWDHDRDGAVRRLRRALEDIRLVGPATNIAFLAAVASHPAFAAADLDTGFIDRHRADLMPETGPASDNVLALAALAVLLARDGEAAQAARGSSDPYSPWHRTDGWQLNADNFHVLTFRDPGRDGGEVAITAHFRRDGYLLELPGGTLSAQGEIDERGDLLADLEGLKLTGRVVRQNRDWVVLTSGVLHRLELVDPAAAAAEQDSPAGRLTAPMPGKVVAVKVVPGDRVERGQALMVLEAMKMEHTILAPAEGVVAVVHFAPGDQVDEGALLLAFEE